MGEATIAQEKTSLTPQILKVNILVIMSYSIADRADSILRLGQYAESNDSDWVGPLNLSPPDERQYILRMLIGTAYDGMHIPKEITWAFPLIEMAVEYQNNAVGIRHPFCYITIRHGEVTTLTDDEWHVDGFSMRVNHLPEQNYIWTNTAPTEILHDTPVEFSKDFDPLRHDINKVFQKVAKEPRAKISPLETDTLYCIDPYIAHRRPPITKGIQRTFVRLSFTPIEIDDVNNTPNPLLPRDYTRDGLEFRNQLEELL